MKHITAAFLSLCVFASAARADEAVIESLLGQVSVKISAAAAAIKGRSGMKLPAGAEVTTAANARCIIRFNATDRVRLAPRTSLIVASVNQGTPTAKDTVLRLVVGSVRAMLNRVGEKRKVNFAIAAGAAVCAVKGTEWDLYFPDPAKPPDVVVANGTVLVGASGPDLAAVTAALHAMGYGQGGTPVPAGFHVHVDNEGHVTRPTPAPVRTTMEVGAGTGKVMVTVNGKTTEAKMGDEIPAGATVQVIGGEVTLSAPGQSISAGDGTTFSFNAAATADGVTTNITVATGSQPVQVETGGSIATAGPGSTVQITESAGAPSTITAQNGSVSVTNAAGTTTMLQQGQTQSTAVGITQTVDATTGQPTDETTVTNSVTEAPAPPELPPVPPDTSHSYISPSGP